MSENQVAVENEVLRDKRENKNISWLEAGYVELFVHSPEIGKIVVVKWSEEVTDENEEIQQIEHVHVLGGIHLVTQDADCDEIITFVEKHHGVVAEYQDCTHIIVAMDDEDELRSILPSGHYELVSKWSKQMHYMLSKNFGIAFKKNKNGATRKTLTFDTTRNFQVSLEVPPEWKLAGIFFNPMFYEETEDLDGIYDDAADADSEKLK